MQSHQELVSNNQSRTNHDDLTRKLDADFLSSGGFGK